MTFENGVFIIDFAKVTTQCDSCKMAIDTSKPKKGKDGKEKSNPAIQAILETGVDSEETKTYHFCDSRGLYQFLNSRFKK